MQLPKQLTHLFDGLVAYAEEIGRRNHSSATAVVVIQYGKIVTESYSGTFTHDPHSSPIGADSLFNIASARKSYIGFAVAYAGYHGFIKSIDDLIADYLPEYDRDLIQGVTIRHLLTHTHGLHHDQDGNLYREFAPGTDWAYRGVNIVMLTEIVRRTTGKTVAQIVDEQVFHPLAFTETSWRTEQNDQMVPVILDSLDELEMRLGTPHGDGDQRNLFVSVRELAYWGYLHLKRGNIEGAQVVPAEIFHLVTSVQSPVHNNPDLPPNGFLWYVQDLPAKQSEIGATVPAGSFQILGVTGPLVLVIPEHDLVVVRMYNKRYNYSTPEHSYLHYLREFGDRVMDCLHAGVK